jgi:hypothetical protein
MEKSGRAMVFVLSGSSAAEEATVAAGVDAWRHRRETDGHRKRLIQA